MGGISGQDDDRPAPHVFISWSHASDAALHAEDAGGRREADAAWTSQVFRFFAALRDFGINADIDLTHLSDADVDWTRFGPKLIRECDVILGVVNTAWRSAWEESGDSQNGRGAAAEVDVLHSIFARDRDAFQGKLLLVLLPGSHDVDVPHGLDRVQRVRVDTFDLEGMTGLLRILTKQPAYPLPPLGQLPVLSPAADALIQRRLEATPAGGTVNSLSDDVTITDSVTVEIARSVAHAETAKDAAGLRDEIALLRSSLDRLPAPAPGEGPHLPWYRAWERMSRQLAALEGQLTALQGGSPGTASPPAQPTAYRLQDLVRQAVDQLARADRCWLVVAATPARRPDADQPAGPAPTREQRREQLSQWSSTVGSLFPFDWHTEAQRRPGRVAFTGELPGMQGTAARSNRWRVELCDDGSAVVCAAVSDDPPPDDPAPGRAVVLQIRRDRLESSMLSAVELAVAQGRHDAATAEWLTLQAGLFPPPSGYHPWSVAVRITEEYRDEDEHRVGDRSVPGAFDVSADGDPPSSPAESVRLSDLDDPRKVVLVAQRLAGTLLEHFGLEHTTLLRRDGTVDPFAATEIDQQLVYQHARHLGLSVDPQGPAARRQRYKELLSEARAQLRPE